jgi:hypothetical protein
MATAARRDRMRCLPVGVARRFERRRLAQNRPQDAGQILASVFGGFVEGVDSPDLREAKLLLDSLAPARP